MPELKRIWLVRDAEPSVLDDDSIQNEEHRLAQFSQPKGHDIDQFVRIITGTPGRTWWEENTKVYTDGASARKDAEKRLAKMRKRYGKQAYSYDRG